MMLPEPFAARVLRDLGAVEGRALLASLDAEPPVSVRLHPLRGRVPAAGEAMGWSRWGYYLPERPSFTLDPAFHAGAYYVQEASSQFVGRLVEACYGDAAGARVLDLCAAPGGKTTLYASLVGPDGLVVANEVNRSRAAVLADNVRKWGLGNVAVTVNDPAQVAALEGWFDVVAVDAPCSGEGMFRKDPASREEWSEAGVALCARRQRTILEEAWRTLRPGGVLIYSTCTFNATENEEVLRDFAGGHAGELEEAPDAATDPAWGVVRGDAGPFRTFRFYPHRARGEGFFAAVARKCGSSGGRMAMPRLRRTPLAPASRTECAELARWVAEPDAMRFFRVGETFYGYRAAQAEAVRMLAGTLSVIASGVELGQLFRGVLRPAHALGLYCGLNRGAVPSAELEREEALRYLRRGEIDAAPLAEGMNLVTCDGLPLGFAKRVGRRCNNLYPHSLRILKS